MNRIRVLQMIDRPFLGGGQAVLLALARGLDPARFEVSIASQGGGPLEEAAREAGIPFRAMPFGGKFSPGLVRAIARALKADPPDVLHTHGGIAGLYGRPAARRAGIKHVVHTIHGIHYLHYRGAAGRFAGVLLERFGSRRTDAVVLVSESDLEEAKKHRLAAAGKLKLVRNGIDVAGFATEEFAARAAEVRLRLSVSSPVVGTVARLHRQKGLIHFMRAVPAILEAHPATRILIVGGGDLEPALRAEVLKLRLDRRFAILGARPEAREILSLFDVFVLPSLWEGLPLVLIEAASLGKPIVATDIGGSREILSHEETGLLVPPGDSAALAGAVNRLLDDPDLAARLGARARETIPPRFRLARMVDEYAEIYGSLTGNT
ncbi:MAG: glycosyltransferase family 4 protein [Acidobacteriota bacterium]|nr:glycosyltransferase family 4 protein [Acidobacteriota bacterium]